MYSVMVVDACFMARNKLKSLEVWGEGIDFQIIDEAENGQAALEKLEVHTVDLIITDIHMPKMNGIELLQRVKERELVPYVVLLSECREFCYAKDAIKYGAFDYLVKPIQKKEFQELLERVKKRLDQRKIESERIQLLEKLIEKNAEISIPKEYIVQIVSYLCTDEWKQAKAFEEIINFIEEKYKNDRAKTMRILEKVLHETWITSLERFSWLELFIDKISWTNVCIQNYVNGSTIKSVLLQANVKIHRIINKFEPDNDNVIVGNVYRYVLENMSREMSLDSIAKELHFNKAYISKLFKQKTGMTVNFYITMVKVERAKSLLTDVNLKNFEIAQKLGYNDADYFNKVFKKYTGFSMINYRKQMDVKDIYLQKQSIKYEM